MDRYLGYWIQTHKILGKGNNAVKLTGEAIKKGAIVAVKGLGGFHLICDATNTKSVEKLRKRKQRPD